MNTKEPTPSGPHADGEPSPDGPDQPALDPMNPASKPQGTTKDQVDTMESEGQAQQQGQEPPPNTTRLVSRAGPT